MIELAVAVLAVSWFASGYLLGYVVASRRRGRRTGPRLRIEVGPITGAEQTMIVLKSTQKVKLSVAALDAEGNPAQVENVRWAVSDPAVGELIEDPDAPGDETRRVLLAGSPSTGQVNVLADAIVGTGENDIAAVLDVEVLAGDAVVLQVNAGAPEDQ